MTFRRDKFNLQWVCEETGLVCDDEDKRRLEKQDESSKQPPPPTKGAAGKLFELGREL